MRIDTQVHTTCSYAVDSVRRRWFGFMQGSVILTRKSLSWHTLLAKIQSCKSQAPKTKLQMVRQAVRQADGPERSRRAHHPEPGRRANPNYPNSKSQTSDSPTEVPVGTTTGKPGYQNRCNTHIMIVWVIEYWDLRFICNLVLEIWDFIFW